MSARPALTGRLPTAATTTMSRTDDGLGEDPPKKPTASAQPTAPSTAATAPSTAATAPTTQPAPTPKTAPTEAAP
ncbi:MAG: hypothetical protein U0271_46575 [Polyangiaceae bacterium]